MAEAIAHGVRQNPRFSSKVSQHSYISKGRYQEGRIAISSIDQLQDLYSAENQLIKALPKRAKAAGSEELRDATNEHLAVTKNQASWLEEIFSNLGEGPKGKKCKGMEGLVAEGSEVLEEDMDDDVRDAALIARRHSMSNTTRLLARARFAPMQAFLGEDEAAPALEEIVNEEKEADTKLNSIAEEINVEAEEVEQPAQKGRKASGKSRSAA